MKRVKRQFVLPRKKTLRIPGSAIEPSTGRALVQPSTLNSKAKRRSKERETTDEQTKDNTKTPYHAPKPKTKSQEISDMTIGLNSLRSGSSRKMNILGSVAKRQDNQQFTIHLFVTQSLPEEISLICSLTAMTETRLQTS
jgi:hypothetical protein